MDRKTESERTLVILACASVCMALVTYGCATESHRSITPSTVAPQRTLNSGPKYTLVVGKFQNRSRYMQGIFSEGPDQLGNQAKTILKTHLQQTGRFVVVDRENMSEIAQEAELCGIEQKLVVAVVVVVVVGGSMW